MSKVDDATKLDMEAMMHLQGSLSKGSSVSDAMQENKLLHRIEAKVKVNFNQNIAVQRYKKTKKTPQNKKRRRYKSNQNPHDFSKAPDWTLNNKNGNTDDDLSEGQSENHLMINTKNSN